MRFASTPEKFSKAIFLVCGLTASASIAHTEKLTTTFEETCKSLIGQAVSRGKVVTAEFVAQGREGATPVPDHCKIQGKLNERLGIEGKKYAIGFELRLPKTWNRRFYFQGGGGTDGVLRPAMGVIPSGSVAPNALSNGFAVVSTDAGHLNEPGPQGSFLFGIDPQARADYGYNHLPVVSLAANELIAQVYGSKPKYAYFVGCSNGGRQGMMATQRFPELFDGVISAAPAYRVIEASLDAAVQTKLFASIAPGDPTRPQLGAALSTDELGVLSKGILQSCDVLDGAADGLVNNIRECKFDPKSVQCPSEVTSSGAAGSSACLTANKVAAIKQIFDGARKSDGELFYSTWPYDPGIASPLWTMWKTGPAAASPPQALNTTLVAGALSHVFLVPPQPTGDLYGFLLKVDPNDALAKANRSVAPYLESGKSIINADSPNLDAFKKRGGKIIFYHGMADGIFSPLDTVKYFEQLRERYGKQAERFSRLYLIPGMGHCSGGPATDQFDAVSELVKWVEDKKAPDTLLAKASSGSDWPNRTRPLCAYPKQAIYSGKGDFENAKRFECK
jgi:feruloyl esterase